MRRGEKGRGEEGRKDLEDGGIGVWSQALEVIQGVFLFVFFLATLQGLWDLSSPIRDRTHALCSGSTAS